MLRGNDGSKIVIIFPLAGSYVRVVKSRFSTTATRHVELTAAQVGWNYVTVI